MADTPISFFLDGKNPSILIEIETVKGSARVRLAPSCWFQKI